MVHCGGATLLPCQNLLPPETEGREVLEKNWEGHDNTSPSDSAAGVTKVHSWIPRSWCYQLLEHKKVRSSHQLGFRAFPSPAPAGSPTRNAVYSWSWAVDIHVVSNFDQGTQKEDLSPNRGSRNKPFTVCSGEDVCLFQMAGLQKGWLKLLTLSDKNQIIW